MELRSQFFKHKVAFGVHAGVVERVLGLGDAQKARGLLENLRGKARHVQQGSTAAEQALFAPVLDNGLG